jgi:6,7-dimethyl-8-ribityllumazine synthase
MSLIEADLRTDATLKIVIIASRWNPNITNVLVAGAHECLKQHGLGESQIDIVRVPGAWELPITADALARARQYHAMIALGCVVRGDTRHYEHVADECARGLMRVSLDMQVPIGNGVLAVETYAQAQARAGGVMGNKGEEAALVVLEMANLMKIIAANTHKEKTS